MVDAQIAASSRSNFEQGDIRIVLALEPGGDDVGPVLFDLAAIAVLGEVAHQACVVILVLADDAEMRVRPGTDFLEQIARARREEPETRGAVLVGHVSHRLHVAM